MVVDVRRSLTVVVVLVRRWAIFVCSVRGGDHEVVFRRCWHSLVMAWGAWETLKFGTRGTAVFEVGGRCAFGICH
jgi:hypothetical protein